MYFIQNTREKEPITLILRENLNKLKCPCLDFPILKLGPDVVSYFEFATGCYVVKERERKKKQ